MANRTKSIDQAVEEASVWHGLVLGQRKDGRPFACEATITPMVDDMGSTTQLIMVRKNFHLISNLECIEICTGVAAEPTVDVC